MAFQNPGPAELKAFLGRIRTVAVVGISHDPDRPSYSVAMYLQAQGYRIVPVRPGGGAVLGEPVYARLDEVPFPVDVVNLFRARQHVAGHIREAMAQGVPALWLQEGVIDESACLEARGAGLFVVQDLCMLKEHRKAGLGVRSSPPARR